MESQDTNILSLLSSSFLFRGLEIQQIKNFAQNTRVKNYRSGQIIIEEELINDKIYIILDGLVKVYRITPDGKEIFLAFEKTQNYLGVMHLDNKPSSSIVEALHPTKTLIFHKKDLVAILQKNPFLWERMYKIILAKMEEIKILQIIRLGNDLYQRTYLILKYLSQFSENHEVILSQESLANIVGATRPRVTETLHSLQKARKIHIFPKRITILP